MGGWSALAREPVSAGTGAGRKGEAARSFRVQRFGRRSAESSLGALRPGSSPGAGSRHSQEADPARRARHRGQRRRLDPRTAAWRSRPHPGSVLPAQFVVLGVVRVATTVTGYRELRVYQLSDHNSLGEGTWGPAADPPPGRSVRSTAIIEPLYRWPQRDHRREPRAWYEVWPTTPASMRHSHPSGGLWMWSLWSLMAVSFCSEAPDR